MGVCSTYLSSATYIGPLRIMPIMCPMNGIVDLTTGGSLESIFDRNNAGSTAAQATTRPRATAKSRIVVIARFCNNYHSSENDSRKRVNRNTVCLVCSSFTVLITVQQLEAERAVVGVTSWQQMCSHGNTRRTRRKRRRR